MELKSISNLQPKRRRKKKNQKNLNRSLNKRNLNKNPNKKFNRRNLNRKPNETTKMKKIIINNQLKR